ncbi:MAG: hypothetical protein FWG29_02190 [Treponema sp.]|nr:hypothetical protein [Treponema sp.]
MKSKLFIVMCLFFVLGQIQVVQAAKPIVYDKSVPAEKSSTLIIVLCGITKFNDKNVLWNGMIGSKEVQIPAGQHSIQVHQSGGGVGYETRVTADVTYNFLPGYVYIVSLGTKDMGGKLNIVGAPRHSGEINQNELVPNPESPDASPFEGTWQYKKGNVFIFSGNEFIWRFGGGNKFRGFFTFDEKTIQLPLFYQFKSKKWVEKFGGIFTIELSGQELRFAGKTLEKL